METGWKLFVLVLIFTVSSVKAEAKCKKCDESNVNCLANPDLITEEVPCTGSCFTLVDSNGKIKRGCVDTSINCGSDNKNCKACTAIETPCNNQKDLFWCKTCVSSTDASCSNWKDDNTIPNYFCDADVKKCVMEIKEDKHTSRRCANQDETFPESNKKSTTCTNVGCNTGMFPSDRRKCLQCDSTDLKCATPTKNPNEILSFACLLYDESEKCFEHGTSETLMSRGCVSSTTYDKCKSENEKCHTCATDGCNVAEFKVDATNKCIQCKSDNANCASGAVEATKCDNKIEYYKTQGCYTNKNTDGKVERGCIQDFECSAASSTCTSCTSGDACNNGASGGEAANDNKDKHCYKCRSDQNPKCASKLVDDSYKSEPCREPVTSDDNKGCYTELYDNVVIRSCLVDADPKTRKDCLDTNYKACVSCKDWNCNKDDPPNSANGVALTSGILVLAMVVLKFF